ncbi:unnamed protein product [Boreogadus saida]
MDEESEEGGPTSKTTLSGEHGHQRKAKRNQRVQQQTADSPGPRLVSMKSDSSTTQPIRFKDGNQNTEQELKSGGGGLGLKPSLYMEHFLRPAGRLRTFLF